MHNEWFIIKDLKGFINASRILVFSNFGSNEPNTSDLLPELDDDTQKELDDVLSYDEANSIAKIFIKKQKNKKTSQVRYCINEDLYQSIINALNDRLVSNILNGLVNKGLIETAFDEKCNDFIFWIKDEHKKIINENFQQPETD